MNAIETLALSKLAAGDSREQVVAGSYEVDVTVRVTGTINIGKDTEKVPTVSLPMKEILALFIARCGCTREASVALLLEVTREAIGKDGKAAGSLAEAVGQVDEWLGVVQRELLAKLPKTPVKGKVTTDLNVEEIVLAAAA